MHREPEQWWTYAVLASIATAALCALEAAAGGAFGIAEGQLTLAGFGADSVVETISACGVLAMVRRIRRNGSDRTRFEATALRITGWCFIGLAVLLTAGAAVAVVRGDVPESSVAGVAVALGSIAAMTALIVAKRRIGRALDSAPILADARCSLVCVYMSVVLLASSALFAATGIAVFDALGAGGLAWFSWREGREALEKARDAVCACEA